MKHLNLKKDPLKKITMLTCYDAWSAALLSETELDLLLVGDSLAMVMHGHESTTQATVEMMELHTQAVARGARGRIPVITDLPFLVALRPQSELLNTAERLVRAGAHAIKIEGASPNTCRAIESLIEGGIAVMGHLGLTPQAHLQLGGFRVQGRSQESGQEMLQAARRLQDIGVKALVLEAIPTELATLITEELAIPTIGIGAGANVDGQVLVLQDMLGMQPDFKPQFLRHFLPGSRHVQDAVGEFINSVQSGDFPSKEESYQ